MAAVISVIVLLAVAGIPLAWITHIRLAVTAHHIGDGLAALPHVLVPYAGINASVRLVTVLGAGVLLLDGALVMAWTPREASELRQAVAVLPLIVLAVLPSTLVRPTLAYLHGLLLFVLLAAFFWGERVSRYEMPVAAGLAGLAAALALIAAPALDRHAPWLNYQSLAGSLAAQEVDRFDWSQHYGPLRWPRTSREVMEVSAARADYWKAENLDVFNGTGWSSGYAPLNAAPPAPDAVNVARFSQTIRVTIRGMQTTNVIAAGVAATPQHVSPGVAPGPSDGSWTALSQLGPGDAYTVQTYSPHPTPAELRAAGPPPATAALDGFRTILLPVTPDSPGTPEIVFPSFHAPGTPTSINGVASYDARGLVTSSPYAGVYALAQRLSGNAATEYDLVTAVESYLSDGFTYDENPPVRRYPLASFLFRDRRGYCQQFAGAMALLLRMGGVPARVSAGFTTGAYDPANHSWVVSDVDAHAWVEAWFPHYGFVRFDPTPGGAPARADQSASHLLAPLSGGQTPVIPRRRSEPAPAQGVSIPVHRAATKATPGNAGVVVAVLGLIGLAGVLLVLRPPPQTPEERLAELERALRRAGRPISAGVTLAGLERRFLSAPGAAAYIRAIRLERFGGARTAPTRAQRRALRATLRSGLGPLGGLRALWALPPQPGPGKLRGGRPPGS